MNICVLGLWHLGTVTAACLAAHGHTVTALDFDPDVIENLQHGKAPVFEPGLDDLITQGLQANTLKFTTDAQSVTRAEIVWIAYDTPVDEDENADIDYVMERATRIFPYLEPGALVLISAQLPVGSTQQLEQLYSAAYPDRKVTFGYSPENLRLGKAISVFTQPDRVVVGLRAEADRPRVQTLLKPFTEHIEWMSVESAEMTKHALNAFLAVSVVFANEIATLCEAVGADAKEVERGLKSEARIGPKAYLGPGAAFAGGTLARHIQFLSRLGETYSLHTSLLSSVKTSNDAHKNWVIRKLSG